MSSVCESEPVGALRSEPEPAAPPMAERVASAQIVVQELSKWIDSHEMNDDLDLLAHETVVSQVLPHTATQPDLRYALFFTILGDGEERARLRRHLQHVVQGRAAFDPLILTRMEEDVIEA